jgi:hypothetical protein
MADSSCRHILIAGPGRSGTTLLVKILGALGFNTGEGRLRFFAHAQAGLESNVLSPQAPYVVKSPNLSAQLASLIEEGRVAPSQIDWLIVPLRALDEAAASRVQVAIDQHSVRGVRGGLVGTVLPARQKPRLAETTYTLFETAARHEIPLIVLEYPRFGTDAEYAFRRLAPLLGDRDYAEFSAAWSSVVDPDLLRAEQVRMPRFATLRVLPWLPRAILGPEAMKMRWAAMRRRLSPRRRS